MMFDDDWSKQMVGSGTIVAGSPKGEITALLFFREVKNSSGTGLQKTDRKSLVETWRH